jgi:hypothetical protein
LMMVNGSIKTVKRLSAYETGFFRRPQSKPAEKTCYCRFGIDQQ